MGTREIRQAQAELVGLDKLTMRGQPEGLTEVRLADKYSEVGRADHMGKRPAEEESFMGNMGSIQWEDSALYTKRGTASHGNET